MPQQPWASGPSEILQHGLSLLDKDSDVNRRLAMLSIDNAVELTIKTFLSLPRRISGINLSRKEYQEISESFPLLLDALEKHAPDKLSGIDLGEIEWFHRLRNQLYHQGNGLTVDREKVEIYAELAKILFSNLFGMTIDIKNEGGHELLGRFLASWILIEQALDLLRTKKYNLPNNIAQNLTELRKIRNEVIHGKEDYKKVLLPEIVSSSENIYRELYKLANS